MYRPRLVVSAILDSMGVESGALAGGVALGIASLVFDPLQIVPMYQVLALAQASILAIVVAIALLGVQIAATEQTVLVARQLRERGYLTPEIRQFVAGIGLGVAGIAVIPFLTDWIPILGPIGLIAVGGLTGYYATANFRSLVSIKDQFLEEVDPETTLSELAASVDADEYLAVGTKRNFEASPERSPVLEIVEIGRRAFEDGDDYTGRSACHQLRTVTIDLFGDVAGSEDHSLSEFPSHDLFGHWNRLIDAAVENGTDRSITRLGHELQSVGEAIATNCTDASYARYLFTVRHLLETAHSNERLRAVPSNIHASILDRCREHEKYTFANHAVVSASTSMRSVSANPPTSDQRAEQGLSTANALLKSLIKQWAAFVATETQEGDQYDELLATFEKYIGRYLSRCYSTDRPFPEWVGENLRQVGEAAAESGDQDTVARVTRMLIECQIVIVEESDGDLDCHLAEAVSHIIDAGGRDGVDAAFDDILAADPLSEIETDTELPPTPEEMMESDLEQRTYSSVIPDLPPLNSVENFDDRVERHRDDVDRYYTEYLED